MIINLRLLVNESFGSAVLPLDYRYFLSSAIYNIIKQSDPAYNDFLHNSPSLKPGLKFTFSELTGAYRKMGNKILLLEKEAHLTVCCHMPETTNHFLRGLFLKKQIEIGDAMHRVHFSIENVEHYVPILPTSVKGMITVKLRPCSPLAVGYIPPGTSKYRFHSPLELPFVDCLVWSWIKKYQAISESDDFALMVMARKTAIEVLFKEDYPDECIVTIKKGTQAEHKIRGYKNFDLKVTAPTEMIELALHTGLGLKNTLGLGCVKLIP